MKKLFIAIKENWNDPVWSKVIATGIIALIGFLFTSLYKIITALMPSISLNKILIEVQLFLSQEFEVSLWFIIIVVLINLTIIFKPFLQLLIKLLNKIQNIANNTSQLDSEELPNAINHSTSLFYYRMAKAFPGVREVTWFNNSKDATNRLKILLAEPLKYKSNNSYYESDPFWWFRGERALFIEKFKKIGRNKVLMNRSQLKIKRIAAYHSDVYYKDYVYVEVEGEKQTGLYNNDIKNQIDNFGFSREEYGIIRNKIGWKTLISRDDYDDGATTIRGRIKDATDAELRIRYLSNYNFIVAAKGSPYNSQKFETESKTYLNKILKKEIEPNDFFEFLEGFQKNEK